MRCQLRLKGPRPDKTILYASDTNVHHHFPLASPLLMTFKSADVYRRDGLLARRLRLLSL
jgi:hypothetical protein